MNEETYTPTVGEARAEFVANKSFRMATGWRGAEEFDRMIAEVERAAAEKALTEFADDYNDIYTGSEMIMQLASADYWRGADDAVQHAIAKLRIRAATY
ncbi:hypothetical protein [Leucobacter sp. NPDC077196]|uniref:hypothetical protein n=1 Tax=Leucobacter sp. NPDC077196 TaxID=3154959 RepID=UPI00343FCBA0